MAKGRGSGSKGKRQQSFPTTNVNRRRGKQAARKALKLRQQKTTFGIRDEVPIGAYVPHTYSYAIDIRDMPDSTGYDDSDIEDPDADHASDQRTCDHLLQDRRELLARLNS